MMRPIRTAALAVLLATTSSQPIVARSAPEPAAAAPKLVYAFSAKITLAPPVEVGEIDGGRRRFIAITGGTISGPRLQGTVLPGGGDWQTILPGGLTLLDARYFLRTADGATIEVSNPGIRTASPEVIERLARGEIVSPEFYYFRTTPSFKVAGTANQWLRRSVFVARGKRNPDTVEIDFFTVD